MKRKLIICRDVYINIFNINNIRRLIDIFWQSTNTAKKKIFLNGLQIYYGEINLVTINGKVEIELSPFGP
jgi:hypothetical protein